MASIKLRRGSGVPSGLTFGEPAFDITNSRLYVGITGGSALVGVAGGGVHSFNGLTGAVTGVTTGTANTFGPLQSFTSGISSSGGTFASQVNFVSGISASGGTFNNDIFVNGVRVGEGGGSIATNVVLGHSALNANTTGLQNVAIGTEASTTGTTASNTTAVGYRALYLNTVDNNTAVGSGALDANTTGSLNVAVGKDALGANTTGTDNVAVGQSSMLVNTTGVYNTAVGVSALQQCNGSYNTAVGRSALGSVSSGSLNVAIGQAAAQSITTGQNNVAIGQDCLNSNIGGNNNTVVGRYAATLTSAGAGATAIDNSVFIGADSRPLATSQTNQIAIGFQAIGDGNNTTVIGNSSTTSTRVFGQLSTNGGICAAGGTFASQVNFVSGISASGITVGNTRITSTNLNGINGFTIRGSTAGAAVANNEISFPLASTALTISSATGVINLDSGLASKTVDYNTAIRFFGYNSGLGTSTNTTIISAGGAGNTLTLPVLTGTLALTNDVVTRFNGLTGSVTGVTTGTANTFGPLQSFTNGISASGGTFTSILIRNSGNTLTTTITAPSTASTNKTITFPNSSGTVALEHSSGPIISDAGGDIVINPFGMTINNLPSTTNLGPTGSTAFMLHLNPFGIPKGCTLTRVLTMQGAPCTGHTGSLIFAVYDTGITNGLPNNLVYASASTQITKTDYQRYTAAPNIYLNAGSYWIGYLMDRTGVTQGMSWATVAGKAHSWDAFANGGRLFNNGQMATIRYRLSGFTLASQLTAGFTSAINSNTNPAIGFGNSETYYDNNSPWVGISVQQ